MSWVDVTYSEMCVCVVSLSHSSVDLGTSSATVSRSLSRGISHSSDSELSSAANQLILDYMKMVRIVSDVLNNSQCRYL